MKVLNWMLLGLVAVAVGCNNASPTAQSGGTNMSVDGTSQFTLSVEPADAMPVGAARESVQNDDSVTLVGTIGGSMKPFVDGLVAFTIVDPKVPYCSGDDTCPTPWDYCCTQDQVKENIATVKFVDQEGNLVEGDARKLLNVSELSTVVVQGKAKRDEQGNLTVTANKIFVRSGA